MLIMRWDRARRVQRRHGHLECTMVLLIENTTTAAHFAEESPQILRRHLLDPGFVVGCMQRVVEASILGRFSEAGLYLSTALAEFARGVQETSTAGREWPQRIRKLCRQIQSHPGRGWNVPDMAAEYHCDPDHFARVFRRITGVTPAACDSMSRRARWFSPRVMATIR